MIQFFDCFDLTSTQDKGLEFWQTKSNAIVLYDPMPSECLVTALNWVTGCEELEVLYRKIVLHPQLAPRVIVESNQHQERIVRVPHSTDRSPLPAITVTPRVGVRCPEEPLEDSPKEDVMKVVATIMSNPDRSGLLKETVEEEE